MLNAGSRRRSDALRAVGIDVTKSVAGMLDRDDVRQLSEADLLDNREVILDGKPYRYGSTRLTEEVPPEVCPRILELAEPIGNLGIRLTPGGRGP